MADMQALQRQRQQLLNEIQRRGGRGKAPQFEQQLAQVEAQLRGARGQGPGSEQGGFNIGGPFVSSDLKLKNAGDVINTGASVAQQGAVAGNTLSNPNIQGPFGGSTFSFDPVTGQPTQNNFLSQGNQGVVQGLQGASSAASQANQGLLNGIGQSLIPGMGGAAAQGFGGGGSPLSTYEKATYGKLTSGLAEQKSKDVEDLRQQLSNQGIPVGSEAYNSRMAALDKRYDQLDSDAKNQAVVSGSQLQFQGVGALGNVAAQGYFNPTFGSFQPTQYQQTDIQGLFQTLAGLGIDKKKLQLAAQQLARSGGGGGGGGGESTSPIIGGFPPGSGI